ncbi:hypothetical protein [Levilactobacillus cerevisiae]|nr:hypothetical protein [Levilactobacillus cerevisiae]
MANRYCNKDYAIQSSDYGQQPPETALFQAIAPASYLKQSS